ncbi:TetR/AcrR family transcriptional regulator [Nocardioides daejeonensis]|uniref:TetR/AcrR family transcriptional regulator n=1 Tax=Nocardioides daejeonensis TaxID=1046556 RepID=UPI000D7478CC|nr:helix-turn-helix domain-containing protein [Nocardioides daejeonensis]
MAGRRERQREATYAEIVSTARNLLAEGAELSLRAIAQRMGMTAPALYRYVASYQELVDLVAFEIDRAATADFVAAAARHPVDDPAARLIAAAAAFRRWALASPREFGLVFANPIADTACVRRDLLTSATSGHFMNGLLVEIWQHTDFPHPTLDELPTAVRAAVEDPLIPMDASVIERTDRGVLWIFMQAWQALYGVVTLEVFGHMDPRIIESAAMFVQMVHDWIPRIGLGKEADRLRALLAEEIARPS